jgi:pimeloyl-ACP methyl ester carboxylesterase
MQTTRYVSAMVVTIGLMTLSLALPTQAATWSEQCAKLVGRSVPKGKVTLAQYQAAGAEGVQQVPNHCKVQGKINERIGSDGKPYAIGFELRLPQSWNGRFYFQGGGGTDGVLRPAMGSMPGAAPGTNALSNGYAVVSTDAGHLNQPGANGSFLFGAEPQSRAEYGHAHLPLVSDAAHTLIKRLYGKTAQRSYFVGCSNGGRQGMMATQRYPKLFDGVIAGAPAYRVVEASMDSMAQTQAFARVAPSGAERPMLGGAFTPAEMKLLADGIVATCDMHDGAQDGMVLDTRRCSFDPSTLQCAADASEGCLSADKAAAIKVAFAGARTGDKLVYSEWPFDPGINAPGWTMWKFGTANANPPNALNTTLVAGALSHVFSTPPVLTNDLYAFALNFNIDKDGPATTAVAPPFALSGKQTVNADSTDVDAFTKRGGKLLMYHGMADAIFSAYDTANYIEQLKSRYGARADEFSRLYLIPGLAHCGGGPATDRFDMVSALVDWVEQGKAPDTLLATASATTPWPNRTRPLCVYPKRPVYNGSGNLEDAASFSCQ